MNTNFGGKIDNKQTKAGANVLGILFVIAFIGAIIGMIIFSKTDPPVCVAIFCSIFGMFGVLSLVQSKNLQGKVVGVLLILVGIIGVGVVIYIKTETDKQRLDYFMQKGVPLLAGTVFALVGFLLVFGTLYKRISQKKKCTLEILAVCTKVDSRISRSTGSHSRSRMVYCPTFEFMLDGEHYSVCDNVYSNIDVIGEGEQARLMVDPKKPDYFYRLGTSKSVVLMVLMGVIFAAAGIIVCFLSIAGN